MPSEAQGHSGHDRARYPDTKDEIGEDPAQWLDKPLFELSADGESSVAGWAIQRRVQGIDDLYVLRHWFEVEHDLDRGPRDRVLEMLQARADYLKDYGERPERCEPGERVERESQWYIVRDGERVPWDEVDRAVAGAAFSEGRLAVATDGGES